MGVKPILKEEDFEAALKEAGDQLVIVDFFATWCGPCKKISPLLETMSNGEFSDCVFLKVDVDELEDLAQKYDISAMPTFVMIKKGEKVGEVVGASEDKIRATIKEKK